MAEDEDVSRFTIRWALAFLVLLGVTIGYPLKFKLEKNTIHDGIFAALCEASVGVLFVGGGFSLHRRSIAKRRKNVEIVRSLVRATGKAEGSLLLMHAHKSVPTWKDEIRNLTQVKNELEVLVDEMRENSKANAADQVQTAIDVIKNLEKEYGDKRGGGSMLQDQFENKHPKGSSPERKVADLPEHWKNVLSDLPVLTSVLTEQSSLLTPMRSATKLMRPSRKRQAS